MNKHSIRRLLITWGAGTSLLLCLFSVIREARTASDFSAIESLSAFALFSWTFVLTTVVLVLCRSNTWIIAGLLVVHGWYAGLIHVVSINDGETVDDVVWMMTKVVFDVSSIVSAVLLFWLLSLVSRED